MAPRKLAELSSTELSLELTRAGLKVSGKHVNDKERFVRLSTYLLDQGDDPEHFEFTTKTESPETDVKIQKERLKLLAKIQKLEKTYFARDSKIRGNISRGL